VREPPLTMPTFSRHFFQIGEAGDFFNLPRQFAMALTPFSKSSPAWKPLPVTLTRVFADALAARFSRRLSSLGRLEAPAPQPAAFRRASVIRREESVPTSSSETSRTLMGRGNWPPLCVAMAVFFYAMLSAAIAWSINAMPDFISSTPGPVSLSPATQGIFTSVPRG